MSDGLRRTRENLVCELRGAPAQALATERVQWLDSNSEAGLMASFLGDLQLRFAFRSQGLPDTPLVPADLAALDLNVQRALAIACLNFKRSHGTPLAAEFAPGVYVLRGVEADVVANVLLDRVFWRKQLERFADGVVVAVPKRGTVYFADARNATAVQELTRLAAKVQQTAGAAALSRGLYRFGDKGWQVHGTLPEPTVLAQADGAALRAQADQQFDTQDDEARLALAAKGQRLVILTIIANAALRAVERQSGVSPWVMLGLSIVVGVVALVGTVHMCSGLRRVQREKIGFMVLCFVPLLNIVSLIYLSIKTTRMLRAAGYRVGLLGART